MASIQGIYVALFGRPADPAGLDYFSAETQDGADLTAIGDLAGTEEYQSRFADFSREEVIQAIFSSLFVREASTEEIQTWLEIWDDQGATINDIAIRILDGARNDDLLTVNAKIAAADLFTAHLDLATERAAYDGRFAESVGRDYISAVTRADAATPRDADVAIRRLFPSEPPVAGGGGGVNPGTPDDDVPPPDVTAVNLSANQLTVDGTAEPGLSLTVSIGGLSSTVATDQDGHWTFTTQATPAIIAAALSNSSLELSIVARDNTGATSAAVIPLSGEYVDGRVDFTLDADTVSVDFANLPETAEGTPAMMTFAGDGIAFTATNVNRIEVIDLLDSTTRIELAAGVNTVALSAADLASSSAETITFGVGADTTMVFDFDFNVLTSQTTLDERFDTIRFGSTDFEELDVALGHDRYDHWELSLAFKDSSSVISRLHVLDAFTAEEMDVILDALLGEDWWSGPGAPDTEDINSALEGIQHAGNTMFGIKQLQADAGLDLVEFLTQRGNISGLRGDIVIDFEDVTSDPLQEPGSYELPLGYQHLGWDNFNLNDPRAQTGFTIPNVGYANGVVSGVNTAYNAFGNEASFFSPSPFDFESAYLAAAWSNGLTVRITGFNGITEVGWQEVVLDTSTAQKVLLNDSVFDQVTRVTFSIAGPGDYPNPAGYTQFTIDDIELIGLDMNPIFAS